MWATVPDVQARWLSGDLPATTAQVQTLIDDAEDVVLTEYPSTPDRIADGTLRQATVVRVVARMVLRVLKNPEGLRTVQESTGTFTGSHTYAGDKPGEVYLTDDDRRDLEGRKSRGAAFTISTLPAGWR